MSNDPVKYALIDIKEFITKSDIVSQIYTYIIQSNWQVTSIGIMRSLAVELAPKIRVNGIAPGFILNPIDNSSAENFVKKIPLQTKGEVENIVQAVEFLLKNKFVTGQILFVDGGASLNHAG